MAIQIRLIKKNSGSNGFQSLGSGKDSAHLDILKASRNGNGKTMQLRTMSRPSLIGRKENQFSQF